MAQVVQSPFEIASVSEKPQKRAAVFWLPLIVVVAVIWQSPNFEWISPRSTPFGGDILQEWVGADLIATGQTSVLYDLDAFKTAQHDAERLGFEWTQSSYYPPIYPPFHYFVFQPFTWIDYRWAAMGWALISALTMMTTGKLLWNHLPSAREILVPGFALAIIFNPFLECLNIGHKSTLLLLILTSAYLLLRNARQFQAGLVFGLIAFKPHLAIVIGLAMLLKGQWRFVLGSLVTLSVLMGGSMLFLGWEPYAAYFEMVAGTGNYIQTGGYDLTDAHSLWGATQLAVGDWLTPPAVKATTVVLSAGVLVLLAASLRGKLVTHSNRFALQYATMVLATLLLSPHLYFYDLTVVLLPFFLITAELCSFTDKDTKRTVMLTAVVLLFVSGLFQSMAASTGIQPSVVMMLAIMVVLVVTISKRTQDLSSTRARALANATPTR